MYKKALTLIFVVSLSVSCLVFAEESVDSPSFEDEWSYYEEDIEQEIFVNINGKNVEFSISPVFIDGSVYAPTDYITKEQIEESNVYQ